MIVQPEPAARPGAARRALRAAGLVAPVALLAVVIGAGVLGPKPEPPPLAASLAAASGASSAETAEARRGPPAWVPADVVPMFPDEAAGLPVRSVPAAQRDLGEGGARPLAVAGWLGGLQRPDACAIADGGDTRGVLSPLCPRRARLVVAADRPDNPGAHLHLTLPPGVRLPSPFEAPSADAAVMAVVLIGRAEPPGAGCASSARGCREQLTVDAVAWADGAAFEPGPVWDAGLEVSPPAIAYRRRPAAEALATRGEGAVLVSAIIRPATVDLVDEEAGAALTRVPDPDGLVWYVRSLNVTERGGGGEPAVRVRWALLDEVTGHRLASGVSGDPSRTSLAPVVPSDVVGLPVRSVLAASADVDAGQPRPIDAITGFLLAWTEPRACTDPIPGLPAVGCARHAVLATEAWPTDVPEGTEPPVDHLHAIVPPGVVVPESALEIEGSDGVPAEVVLVLRAATRADCPSADACAPWIVERVAWADGQWLVGGRQSATPLIPDPADPTAQDPARSLDRSIASNDLLLRAVLLGRDQLRLVDPAAALALRRAETGDAAHASVVWYLRGLDVRPERAPRIRWALLAAPSDRVLAVGAAPGAG